MQLEIFAKVKNIDSDEEDIFRYLRIKTDIITGNVQIA